MSSYEGNQDYYDAVDRMLKYAGDTEDWNSRFVEGVRAEGYVLIPVEVSTQLGKDGPLMAPFPSPDCPDPYPYPCVIARPGWTPPENPQNP